MLTNDFMHTLRFSVPIFLGLICASCARYQPDYAINGLRVNAEQINIGTEEKPNYRVTWNVETLIFNIGKSIVVDEFKNEDGIPISHIPVMFTAYVSNKNLQDCPTESTESLRVYRKPGGLMMRTWRYLPISNTEPVSSFSNIFITSLNCLPGSIVVDFDSRQSVVFAPSTINEANEENNSLNVAIVDYPEKSEWETKRPEE